jgi:hypothetical protein
MLATRTTTTASSSTVRNGRARALITTLTKANHHPLDRDQSSTAQSSSSTALDRAATCACALALSIAAFATPAPSLAADLAAANPTTTTTTTPTTLEQRASDRLAEAFQQRQYYVTGDLPEGLFDDQCVFIDPTTRVVGAQKYAAVVAQLFDASNSRADLLSIAPGPQPSTIELKWRLEGQLALPGNPPIKAYTGTTLYRLDPTTGRVKEQVESWDITAFDAFASSFLPKALWQGAPPAPPVEVLLKEQQQQR